ncbi:MAG: DUF2141 domain-containing protein [Flavobacteriales bacterium]|nr:DUF2141 domain-containing protein [Flavobacteriales bacterium]
MRIEIRTVAIMVICAMSVMFFQHCSPADTVETTDAQGQPDSLVQQEEDELVEGEVTDGATETLEKIKTDEALKQKPLLISITNLKSTTAPVIFSVYANEATYLDPGAHLKTYRFVPKGKTLRIRLTDLEFGTYSIAFYQDMNDNGRIDKNGLGIPNEPYAFSNDIRPKLRAPSFKDCKFVYSSKKNIIKVKMGK